MQPAFNFTNVGILVQSLPICPKPLRALNRRFTESMRCLRLSFPHGVLVSLPINPPGKILKQGGSALDAVIQGVEVAERDPAVRAFGYGGYPNAEGEVEVDAAVVDGRTLGYGAVAGLKNIATPTAVARRVMEKTDHVFLVGEGALQFARTQGFQACEMLTEDGRKAWGSVENTGRQTPPRMSTIPLA